MKCFHPYFSTLYFLCIMALAGCENFIGPKPIQKPVLEIIQHPLLPLKVGNFWRYATISYYPIPNIYDTLYSPGYSSTISSDTIIEYQQAQYRCVAFSNIPKIFFYSTASEMISFQTFDASDSIFKNISSRYPVRLNDTNISVFGTLLISRTNPVIQRDTNYSVCISTNEEFQTFAGKFRCIVTRSTNTGLPGYIGYSYSAPGIGQVGSSLYFINPNDRQAKEILQYKNILIEYKVQ